MAQLPGEPNPQSLSRNKKYSAEVSTARLDKPLLSVFDRTGDHAVHLWSKSLVPDDADENELGRGWDENQTELVVADDGSFVVVRARYLNRNETALRVLTKTKDQSFGFEDLLDLFSAGDELEPINNGSPFFEVLATAGSSKIYGLWEPLSSEWGVLDLVTLTLAKADPEQSKRLDELALPRAREIVREAHPSGFRKMLRGAVTRAAQFVPAIAPKAQEQYISTESAIRYLGYRKLPEDRTTIEGLLATPLNNAISYRYLPPGREVTIELASEDRALADNV